MESEPFKTLPFLLISMIDLMILFLSSVSIAVGLSDFVYLHDLYIWTGNCLFQPPYLLLIRALAFTAFFV